MVRSSDPPRSRRLVADDADLVAVGVAHIGAVVVGMIVLSDAGRTFILAAGLKCRSVSGIDRRAIVGIQADSDAVAHARRLLVQRPDDPEPRPVAGAAVTDPIGIVGLSHQAERRGHAVIKGLGLGDVVGADGDVAEHVSSQAREDQDAAGAYAAASWRD